MAQREIVLHTLSGVPDAEITTHYVETEDKLGLSMLRFQRAQSDDVVVLIHGMTTSSDLFIMPEHYNLVRYLLDHGFGDVWALDLRMSNRYAYNLADHRYSLDDMALYDIPAAFAKVREQAGDKHIHVICQCIGSLTFMMSLFGKVIDHRTITSVIANSVALTPRIPRWSQIKIAYAPFLLEYILGFPYVNPNWSDDPWWSRGKIFSMLVSLAHPECDERACHMLSLMWGTGRPAVYNHENLADVTHRRIGDLHGGMAVHYYRHICKMARRGNWAVKYDPRNRKYDRLPNNYFQYAKDITTPILFTTGADNRVFADSNILCYRRMQRIVPERHELHIFPRYCHQDVFIGKNAHVDIFPHFLEFLNKHRTETLSVVAATERPVALSV